MGRYTKEQAHSEYLEVIGNKYEFLQGPKTGHVAEVRSYELTPDGNTLYFVMTNNVKIESKKFYDIMMSVGASDIQDPLFTATSNINNNNINNNIESKLDIMSDEEEAELNKKIKQNNNIDNSKNKQDSTNPIDLILLKRKNKVNVEIPINIEIEFIDKSTFDLINITFDNATENIINHFMNNVDTKLMKTFFEKSMKKYIFENFLNIEYIEETETLAEDPESGQTEILKWESEPIQTSEEHEFEKK